MSHVPSLTTLVEVATAAWWSHAVSAAGIGSHHAQHSGAVFGPMTSVSTMERTAARNT